MRTGLLHSSTLRHPTTDVIAPLPVPDGASSTTGVTVRQVLAMPPLRGADPVVLAGSAGLDRAVRWVHTTELVDVAPLLRGGDLVLSTGIALPDTPADLGAFAESLDRSQCAGLVIELGRRWGAVPEALVAACERRSLPLVALPREVRFAAVAQAIGERIVDRQLTELREAQRVHEVFTELSIAEAGPSEILDAVQRLAGTTVVLEDEQKRLLDYRPGPGDTATFLGGWQQRSREVVLDRRTTWDPANGWLLTRVGRPDRAWGRLVIQSPDAPPPSLVATAERAAAALALHRLHDRQRDSLTRRTHHEILVGLLADPTSSDVLQRCELAGLPVDRRSFVGLTVRPVAPLDEPVARRAAQLDAVLAAVVHATHEERVPALVSAIDGVVRILLSFAPSADAERAVEQLAGRVHRRSDVLIGAGHLVGRASQIDRTLHESLHVVDSARPGAAAPLVHRLGDVHLRGLLAMLADDDRVRLFVSRELDQLREHDARWQTDLLDAVRALVFHPCSKSEAAASLHMSRPAFYDRLAKVERLLGVDLDDPDIRLSLHAAVVAEEVLNRRRDESRRHANS
ncbi:PucR family transcriptional regulator ligand-binding domain-containing protein [Blastococcus sp. BMG 814]|uniref:PucR family transcriptional regulator ligand-binding domain-containing protein n=1 Tax=Blastococcus carthaginiensis TaxID=3050034 RepID=A0ABT9IDF8_9ACTN|nr:PucR family transcriptional regulator [Blastococcus carthaginiensis]MDP5183620.1 PucR family transcriptional regulator ligand-binding domain-containing protein [Blastococcus carthaginiensis]